MQDSLQKVINFAFLFIVFMIFYSLCGFEPTIITILLLMIVNMRIYK